MKVRHLLTGFVNGVLLSSTVIASQQYLTDETNEVASGESNRVLVAELDEPEPEEAYNEDDLTAPEEEDPDLWHMDRDPDPPEPEGPDSWQMDEDPDPPEPPEPPPKD